MPCNFCFVYLGSQIPCYVDIQVAYGLVGGVGESTLKEERLYHSCMSEPSWKQVLCPHIPVPLTDDCSPGQHFYYNLMRITKPEPFRWATTQFLLLRNWVIINIFCFKLLSLEVICGITMNNQCIPSKKKMHLNWWLICHFSFKPQLLLNSPLFLLSF